MAIPPTASAPAFWAFALTWAERDSRRVTEDGSGPSMMIGTCGNFARTLVTKFFTASVIFAPSLSPLSIALSALRLPMVMMRFGDAAQTALTRASTSKPSRPLAE